MLAREIVAAVANHYGISYAAIIGHGRQHKVIVPRHAAMWILRQRPDASYPWIARQLRRKDHTTVMAGVAATQRRMELDPSFAADLSLLREALHAG